MYGFKAVLFFVVVFSVFLSYVQTGQINTVCIWIASSANLENSLNII